MSLETPHTFPPGDKSMTHTLTHGYFHRETSFYCFKYAVPCQCYFTYCHHANIQFKWPTISKISSCCKHVLNVLPSTSLSMLIKQPGAQHVLETGQVGITHHWAPQQYKQAIVNGAYWFGWWDRITWWWWVGQCESAIKVKNGWPKTFDLAQPDQLEPGLGSQGCVFLYQLIYKVCNCYARLADSFEGSHIGESAKGSKFWLAGSAGRISIAVVVVWPIIVQFMSQLRKLTMYVRLFYFGCN